MITGKISGTIGAYKAEKNKHSSELALKYGNSSTVPKNLNFCAKVTVLTSRKVIISSPLW